MVTSPSHRRRATRFDQISAEKQARFSGAEETLALSGKLRSWKGQASLRLHFEKALKGYEAELHGFVDADLLLDGFVLTCNKLASNPSPRSFEYLRSGLKRGLLTFARQKSLHNQPLSAWPRDFGLIFAEWLRKCPNSRSEGAINANTARKRYGIACALLAELGEHSRHSASLPAFDPFPEKPFSGAHADAEKTKSLGIQALIQILIAARTEFLESRRSVEYAEKVLKGKEVLPDQSRKGEGRYANLDAVLWWLHKKFPDRNFPSFTSLIASDGDVTRAISKWHGGWRKVAQHFFPLSENLVAPMVLLTIYGHFNVEPLRILRFKQVRRISLFQGKQVEIRTLVQPGKERASAPYTRSFAIDEMDDAAPHQILEFIEQWTRPIRSRAGKYADCYFIGQTQEGEVKAFNTAQIDANSSDQRWKNQLAGFSRRHSLPMFGLRELRQTALDFGRLISNNDVRAVLALKGGTSESVLDWHYRSDAAESRAQAEIASLQASKERYLRSRGKIHHQGAPATQDITAATPGCKCADPYDSPISGESKGSQCQAFACCPGCPHGSPELGSIYALARLLQLREALIEGRLNLPLERWSKRYQRSLEVLEKVWLPQFDDVGMWERVKRMTLLPIGTVE